MPRGKFMNHKGQSRQFTPVEELQRELEENLTMAGDTKGKHSKEENTKGKKMGGPVEGLIEISNPNRQAKKSTKYTLSSGSKNMGIEEHGREKLRMNQKTSSEIKADLARLALVRKKREAAAEERLAKKENSTATPSTSKSDTSMQKKKTHKFKSAGVGLTNFLKNGVKNGTCSSDASGIENIFS